MAITLTLGIRAFFDNNLPLSFVLLFSAFLFGLCKAILLHSKYTYSFIVAPFLLVLCLMGLMLFLVVDGGVAGTGPLWIYVLPPVAMFFAGVFYGVITMSIFTLLCAIILFYPDDAMLSVSYSYEFKLRLLFSFATVTFLSAFYEHSRQTSFAIIKEISERFEQQALNDPLTKLPNRRGVQQFLEQELGRAQREEKPLTMILCDIDRFKRINDTFGHDGGDIALKHVSALFKSSVRHQDVVSRWGGEEFLFVLPATDEHSGVLLAEKIRANLADSPVEINQQLTTITASFGVAQVELPAGLNNALSLADKALYLAKEKGRNKVLSTSSLPL